MEMFLLKKGNFQANIIDVYGNDTILNILWIDIMLYNIMDLYHAFVAVVMHYRILHNESHI